MVLAPINQQDCTFSSRSPQWPVARGPLALFNPILEGLCGRWGVALAEELRVKSLFLVPIGEVMGSAGNTRTQTLDRTGGHI